MYERFRDSLVNPTRIVEFRKDKVILVILYVLFFAALLSTRTTIEMVTFNGIRPNTQEYIKNEMTVIGDKCAVVDATVTCDSALREEVYVDGFIRYHIDSYGSINPDMYAEGYNIIFHKDNVALVFNGTLVNAVTLKISDLPESLHNLDFALQETDPDQFYTELVNGINTFLLSQKPIFAPIMIIMEIISNFILFMIFVLISSWFMNMRFKPIKYRDLFVMTAYAGTALYLILIFDSLFSLSFFLIVILILIAFRQNNALSRELFRRLHTNQKTQNNDENDE
ncbi:MAG: DUF1189 family protein [Candidatus Izemoplasma sp.]|nr:DUF1189 family protein [Candidatus Izemoplasma sp.]